MTGMVPRVVHWSNGMRRPGQEVCRPVAVQHARH